MREKSLEFDKKIKFVFTTAESLLEHQRISIEQKLGPVIDSYGCSEINGIAYQCKKCKEYHIIDPHVYLEFGGIVNSDASRELLITDLDNLAFPLIKYRNGDMGIASDNERSCHIPFSRLNKITGRESDVLMLPGGGTLSVPSFFGSSMLKNIRGIKMYQIEKVKQDFVRINLLVNEQYTNSDEHYINEYIASYLNNKIGYEINYPEHIEPSRSGKHKLLVDKTR
jgi:phenylacetate-CoA ligase